MKEYKIKFESDDIMSDVTDAAGNVYSYADSKNMPALFWGINEQLRQHNLKLRIGDLGDDNYWFSIVAKEEK